MNDHAITAEYVEPSEEVWLDVSGDPLWRIDSMDAAFEYLGRHTRKQLVHAVVNTHLNRWVAEWADDNEDREKVYGRLFSHSSGKRIPYVGWYWRATDFAGQSIPIANCGDFIGVCENNKWGYDQRHLTPEECEQVTTLIWHAESASHSAGTGEEQGERVSGVLSELWDLFQTFEIPRAPWNE